MKLGLIFTAMVVSSALTGCSQSVPACSDSEATELVIEISNGELAKTVSPEMISKIKLSVDAIRTTDTNDKTGAHSCAANLAFSGPNGTNSIPITYTVEMTDNGEEFYVNVFGL